VFSASSTEGFNKSLELVGVGYRAQIKVKLDLALGFLSHIVL
jgi:ribosomal protein L6P/L9E